SICQKTPQRKYSAVRQAHRKLEVSKCDLKSARLKNFAECVYRAGVAMLSSVIISSVAINVNIQIIRVFTRMREMLLTHKDLLLEMEEIRKKVTGQDDKIELIFNYLKQFIKE